MNEYYTHLKFPIDMPELITKINDFVKDHIDEFHYSATKQFRINFTGNIKEKITAMMPFEVSDMGVYQNFPGWSYPVHKDVIRKFAINMVLSDDNSDFEVMNLNDNKTEKFPIRYIKNEFVLLNTQKNHYVKNNSSTASRFCVSIGCTSVDYFTIKELFKQNNNISVTE